MVIICNFFLELPPLPFPFFKLDKAFSTEIEQKVGEPEEVVLFSQFSLVHLLHTLK